MPQNPLTPPSPSKEEALYNLLQKECRYYLAILELTQQEREKYQNGRPLGEIASLMKRRRILMSCVEEIELGLVPLKKYWIENKDESHPLHSAIQEILEALDLTVKRIIDLDEENQAALEEHRMALTRRVNGANKSKS